MTDRYQISSPSNIAFIKYWGKKDGNKQWPANGSLSMTLNHSKTITTAQVNNIDQDELVLKGSSSNQEKGIKHIQRMRQILRLESMPFLKITTENTFPTACGIASSASGLSALTLACLACWTRSKNLHELEKFYSREQMAHLSRMGSGSAGRSLWGGYVSWEPGPSSEEQILKQEFDKAHWDLCDVIVIISSEEKAQSSSKGHEAAWESPLFSARLAQLPYRLQQARLALIERDLNALGDIIEQDALDMHSVMMTGVPKANYFKPKTSEFISWLRTQRHQGNLKAWFTIDAGPNVHVICERRDLDRTIKSIKESFPGVELITDDVGSGPTLNLIKD